MSEQPEDYITLGAEEIKARSTGVDSVCGIYFLILDNEIVYVGQSVNIPSRIDQHRKDPTKTFDRFFSIPCGILQLDMTEAVYINKFMPKHNKVIPKINKARRKYDYSYVWFNTPSLHVFPLITIMEWIKLSNVESYNAMGEGDFAGFMDFAGWWKKTHKELEHFCLPSDVCKWFEIGCPSEKDV